ncbi:radical SAM protein [bacterium]|nr:radical SAM protein [candidate division CSSED10-310 bacterium]
MRYFPPEIFEPDLAARLLQWRQEGYAPPFRLHAQITRRCNLNCRMCWQPGERLDHAGEMPEAAILPVIEAAAEAGIRDWNIIGGEPLMRRGLVLEMVRGITAAGMNGDLSTNGTMFDEEIMETLAATRWRHVRISIDSPDERDHDYLRGRKGTLAKALEALRGLAQIRKRKTPGLEIMMVMSRRNYHRLPDMVRLCLDLDVDRLTVQPMSVLVEQERAALPRVTDLEAIEAALDQAILIADEKLLQHNLRELYEHRLITATTEMDALLSTESGPGDDFLDLPCFDPWFLMALRPDGSMGPCDRFDETAAPDHQVEYWSGGRLLDIWSGPFFSAVRDTLRGRVLPAACRDCCVCKVSHIRFLRTQALLAAGEYDAAEAWVNVQLAKNPRKDIWWMFQGHARYGRRRFAEALQSYEAAQRINPAIAWYPMGECLKHLGRPVEATQALRHSLRRSPERWRAWFSLAEIQLAAGDPGAAQSLRWVLELKCPPEIEAVVHSMLR